MKKIVQKRDPGALATIVACLALRSLKAGLNAFRGTKSIPARFGLKSSRHESKYFQGDCALTRLDWKHEQARLDPTITLTLLIGMATAAFLATAM